MLRARYPLLAFVTLAAAIVGYTFLASRGTSREFHSLVGIVAGQVADLVADVPRRNDAVRREAARLFERLDELILGILAAQIDEGSAPGRATARLQLQLRGLHVDRALLIDAEGRVLLDEGRPARPGKSEPSPLERIEEAEILREARAVARGESVTPESSLALRARRRAYRRLAGDRCLVLARSAETLERMRFDSGLETLLREQFAESRTVAYVRIENTKGDLVAGAEGHAATEVLEERRAFEAGGEPFTLRVGINLDEVRAVEARARQLPLLIALALLLGGGAALAFVFRQQHAHLERERLLGERADQDRRLSSLGRLTAGVAHEIKNPLNAIRIAAGRLARRAGEGDRPILAAIEESVLVLSRTAEDFMKLARDPRLVLVPGDPAAVVEEAVAQVRPMAESLGRSLGVRREGGPGAPDPLLDAARLREAIVNLLRNGLQASRSRVEACVRQEESMVRILIDDDGPGVPADQRQEIFGLFYTTKPEGTGLGLPLAHRVAEEHGGTLVLSESPTGGARFTLSLPCPRT